MNANELIKLLKTIPEDYQDKEVMVMNLPLIGAVSSSGDRTWLKGQQVSNAGVVDGTPFIVISQKEPTV